MPVRLAVMNDYEVVVRGVAGMLRTYDSEITLVEVAAGTRLSEPVDIALYDTFTQPQADPALVRSLVSNPNIGHLVIYTWNFQRGLASQGVDAGASGYLSKSLPAAGLTDALRRIHHGEVVVSPAPPRAALAAGDWPGREEGLTARESEVIALITDGMSNNAIAERTSLSINSVKSYIRTAYRKMGVSDRANAVLWGVEHGFMRTRMRAKPDD